jgi:hypothetical protein
MPQPSSITWISVRPACITINLIDSDPASMALSNNSLATDAGRWMTSPAAILFDSSGGIDRMIDSLVSLGVLFN